MQNSTLCAVGGVTLHDEDSVGLVQAWFLLEGHTTSSGEVYIRPDFLVVGLHDRLVLTRIMADGMMTLSTKISPSDRACQNLTASHQVAGTRALALPSRALRFIPIVIVASRATALGLRRYLENLRAVLITLAECTDAINVIVGWCVGCGRSQLKERFALRLLFCPSPVQPVELLSGRQDVA